MWNLAFSTCLQPLGFTQHANNGENVCLQLQHHTCVLSLILETDVFSGDAAKNFEQVISRFQVANFSVLELELTQRGHVYGAIVLRLLGLCTSIQRLKIRDACPVDCHCDQPNNWRSQSISVTDLKEVEIQGFRGEGHEVDLLRVLLRSVTVLERLTEIFQQGLTK
uniref:FBD domain-containing protein n=1 Tax=Arundo donax TaxID=35708 RepID=A0A0A9GZY4_ARUDO